MSKQRLNVRALIFLLACTWAPFTAAGNPSGDTGERLRGRLTQAEDTPLLALDETVRARATVARFYARRVYRPAWQDTTVDQLIDAVIDAEAHGLEPTHYHLDAIRRARTAENPVALELLASDAYLTLAAHLLSGRLNPVTVEPDWTAIRRERDLAAYLEQAVTTGNITDSLEQLAPPNTAYAELKLALQRYRKAAADGGWQRITEGPALKPGDVGARVRDLRQRLRATGLIDAGGDRADTFDTDMEIAVAAFQRRIGLEPDGIVGPVTLRELNRSPAYRIAQIRVNLERWRWLPDSLGQRHIRVNIADYRLQAVQDGRVEREHDVIVGRTYRKTPVFSGQISYVVLNPWWETPHNLARLDKLPAFRKDPASAERLGFEVLDRNGSPVPTGSIDWSQYTADRFPFRLRQRPGPLNALGQVKLMFPNPHNVYLHDTPGRELFNRGERAFSSGCIRVADALGLTSWVLAQTPGWDRRRIDSTLDSQRETRVDLATRVPVHILYFTAVVDDDGALRLVNDIYDRDQRVFSALNQAPDA
ncbi:MAG: L,D-transpeptidase family protein [Gammaproteobacteria bacterium]|nr:L,D-transpeptidase family protein [Gammaproteobacteria bacterium]